jgi:hypothetical protein
MMLAVPGLRDEGRRARRRARGTRLPRPGGGNPTVQDEPGGALLVLYLLCLGMGIVLVVVGLQERGVRLDLADRGVPARATVVAVHHKATNVQPSGRLLEWTEVTVAFTDDRGIPRRAGHNADEATRVGDSLRIVYDPLDPSHARWDGVEDDDAGAMILGAPGLLFGAIMLIKALVGVLRRRPRPRSASLGLWSANPWFGWLPGSNMVERFGRNR